MTNIDPLFIELLKESRLLKQNIKSSEIVDVRELILNCVKTTIAEDVFSENNELSVVLKKKIKNSDIKYAKDYFAHLANVVPKLTEPLSAIFHEYKMQLSGSEIDQKIKHSELNKSELLSFISQIYFQKIKEIEDIKESVKKFEMRLKETRKAYESESDLKRLHVMEKKIADSYHNYNQHIKYLKVCEEGMVLLVENYFNFAKSILLRCKLST